MEYLFSYGTLQQTQVQLDTFGRRLLGTADTLLGYQLGEVEIKDPEVIKSSGKSIHPILKKTENNQDEILGTVFAISQAELQQSDDYEVKAYKRVKVTLKSGQSAWIYASADE